MISLNGLHSLTFSSVAMLSWLSPALAADPKLKTSPIAAVVPDLKNFQIWNEMEGDSDYPFWADDDNLYHFSCDGRGFGKKSQGLRNLCRFLKSPRIKASSRCLSMASRAAV